MFYMVPFWQILFSLEDLFPLSAWWNTLETYGQRITMNGTFYLWNLLLSDHCKATWPLLWSTVTSHATPALTWYSHAVLKQSPWTGFQVGFRVKQTNKNKLASQMSSCRATGLPYKIFLTRLYSLLINWFPSIMWWGACSQANVSMYCCTYAIVACIYKQHRNSKQAFLRLKLTEHIKKPRFPLISIYLDVPN